MTQSPELAGGAGFTFADQIAVRYLASLLASAPGPGTNERRVSRVALEQRAAGEPLDDIIVDATAPDGSIQRLSLQAKRKLTISAAASNTDFRSIIQDCWATLDKPDFRTGTDYIGAAVGASTAVGTTRDLQAVAEFARASATASDFARRFAKVEVLQPLTRPSLAIWKKLPAKSDAKPRSRSCIDSSLISS